ncbi:MAG: hypothetical protein AAGA46_03265 [Cyanobacteria bacterium P01_F01_bin.13]
MFDIPDSVFKVVDLGENLFILAGVLGILARQFQTEKGTQVLGSIEQLGEFADSGVDYAQEALNMAKLTITTLKERYEGYKSGGADGVSLAEAAAVKEDMNAVSEKIQEILDSGEDEVA